MKISEHANYLLNEYGRLQFDYAAYCKPYGESLRNEARNNLEEYIAELEAAQRWIPVSERLPEESDWTLIRYKGYRVPYTLYYDIDRGWACGETPDYWMSLPEMQEVNNE